MPRRWSPIALCVLVACAHDPGVRSERADTLPRPTTATIAEPSTAPTTTDGPSDGTATGVGDALFPALGNPGLDVSHYDVALSVAPGTGPSAGTVEGSVTLDVALTSDRDTITLDSNGPEVSAVTVDGVAVPYEPAPPELLIDIPDSDAGDRLQVTVQYRLQPQAVTSDIGMDIGWLPTAAGSYVLNEPDGANTWLPCNDHPSDPATYTFRITVPSGVTAVANGALVGRSTAGGEETFVWQEQRPMASYLIQVLTGDYAIVEGTGPDGLPLVSAVLRADVEHAGPALDLIDDQLAFFTTVLGPYPLDRYGIAITDSTPGLAMETMERSMFSRDDVLGPMPPGYLFAHELAHQWFGDAVTLERWGDIWLNESFATYASWLWMEHVGQGTVDQFAEVALVARYPGATGTPTVEELFGFNSYDGGAVVLHALRGEIGDDAFFTLLRRWVADNAGTARGTDDFVALAEQVAGRSLTDFFATWLYSPVVPSSYPR